MPILPAEPSRYPEELFDDLPEEMLAGRRWWAVYTKARMEKSLARELYRWEIPFFLPLVLRNLMYRGRKTRSYTPVFTGYLFLLATSDERQRAFSTNRIVQTIEVDDQDQLWFDLRQISRLIDHGAPLTVEAQLAPGRRVRIKSGSFAGTEGVVEQRRAGTRLIVAVQFLQQGVSLDVEDFQLEPID